MSTYLYTPTSHDKQHLSLLSPKARLLQQDSIPLWKCYQDPNVSVSAQHYIERTREQREGMEATFRHIEDALAQRQLWSALRDFYLRYIQRYQLETSLRTEALRKALLLSLQIVPHETYALQLLQDVLSRAERSKSPLSRKQLLWAIQIFQQNGWQHSLRILLRDLRKIAHAYHLVSFLHDMEALHPIDDEQLTKRNQGVLRPIYAPKFYIEKNTTQKTSTSNRRAEYWIQLLSHAPSQRLIWESMYESTIPQKDWMCIRNIWDAFEVHTILYPQTQKLRTTLAHALQDGVLGTHKRMLTLLLRLFELHPCDRTCFEIVQQQLRTYAMHELHRTVVHAHISALIQRETNTTFEELYKRIWGSRQWLSSSSDTQTFSDYVQRLVFFPEDKTTISELFQWSHDQEEKHPVHKVLLQMALEGRGSNSFKLKMAQKYFIKNEQHTSTIIEEHLLKENSDDLCIVQTLRTRAEHAQAYTRVIELLQHESKLQTSNAVLECNFLQQIEILGEHLRQPGRAYEACQEALKLQPSSLRILEQMVRWTEANNVATTFYSIQRQHTTYPIEQTKLYSLLQKILTHALDSLEDISLLLDILFELVTLPNATLKALTTLEKLLSVEGAPRIICAFLEQHKASFKTLYQIEIQLLFIRSLFAMNQREAATQQLQEALRYAQSSLAQLEHVKAIAIEYNVWDLVLSILEQEIQWVQAAPMHHKTLSHLYTQVGTLHRLFLQQPKYAQRAYKMALLYSPTDTEVFEQMYCSLRTSTSLETSEEFIHTHTSEIPNTISSQIYTRISFLELHGFKNREKSIEYIRLALQIDPQNQAARAFIQQNLD